jgi:5-formyltetrahydrofolate cyclo-ligase
VDLSAASEQVRAEKRALRKETRERRRTVTAEASARAGERAAVLLDAFLASSGRAPSLVLLYAGLPGELDTRPLDALLCRRGATIAWPRVAGPSLRLHVAAHDQLAPGGLAIREPAADLPEVAPSLLDLAVVPGLAFDRAGHRLGSGRGYYDALLERAPQALRVGVCLPAELIPRVPSEPHDVLMDLVIADEVQVTGARPLPPPKEVAP